MTRELSDKKNLQEAIAVRKSGFKTKVHASPHKNEIDEWIIVRRWSSNMIVNELKRLYPNENHPSNRAIDNYRKKYLPAEFAKASKMTAYPEVLRDRLIQQFDPAIEGNKLWKSTTEALDKAMETMRKTPVPPKFLIELLKVGGQNFQIVCDIYARLGLIKQIPTEISVIEKRTYEPGELKAKIEQIIAITKRIEQIKSGRVGEFEGGDTSDESGIGGAGSERNVPEEHRPDVGGDTGVQESEAH